VKTRVFHPAFNSFNSGENSVNIACSGLRAVALCAPAPWNATVPANSAAPPARTRRRSVLMRVNLVISHIPLLGEKLLAKA
jgi:hypothetical protein